MMDSQPLTDEAFLAAFLDCSISPTAFNHQAHVRAAWLLLRRYPLEEAVERICQGIARLAAHLGAPGKFHRTLTEALVRVMAGSGAADHAVPFSEFVRANPALMEDANTLMSRHYSPQRMASAEARERFVTPDRLPLPGCKG